jgi:hypothetical protein
VCIGASGAEHSGIRQYRFANRLRGIGLACEKLFGFISWGRWRVGVVWGICLGTGTKHEHGCCNQRCWNMFVAINGFFHSFTYLLHEFENKMF